MTERLRVAYCDPPYVGQAKKKYKDHPDYAGEVDHEELIDRVVDEFPDGWALSASSPSLRVVLPLCPPQVRVMAWVKPFAAYKVNVRVAYSWEPVIICPPRRLDSAHVHRDFGFDEIVDEVVSENITMRRGLAGAKPERFCFWLFNVLGLRPVDEFVDLFPGTKGVTAAWEEWCQLGGPKLKQTIKTTNDLIQANPFLAQ